MPLNSLAQGTNDGLGEEEVDLKSLYEMVSYTLIMEQRHKPHTTRETANGEHAFTTATLK